MQGPALPSTPPPSRLRSFLPRSLVGRVFGLFSLWMLVLLVAGLGMFYRYQYLQHIEETQDSAQMLVEIVTRSVEESVVIGDYDTVKRTLNQLLIRSPFKQAEFLDLGGGAIRLQAAATHLTPAPAWFTELIVDRFYDVNRVIAVGGKDYGVIRLTFDEQRLAAQLWSLVAETSAVAWVLFMASLALTHIFLRRWLENLGGLRLLEHDLAAGRVMAEASFRADAPSEIQEAILAVNRGAASLRVQYGQQIESLMNSLMQHKSAMDQAAIVSEIDTQGRIVNVNALFQASSGHTRAELIGQPLSRFTRAPDGPQWQPDGAAWTGEVAVLGHARGLQWQRTIVPIFDADNVLERYICIDIDITARKEFERTIVANARRERLVADLGRAALATGELDHLFGAAAQAAASALGASAAAVFEFDERDGARHVTVRAGAGLLAHAAGLQLSGLAVVLQAQPADQLLRPMFAALGESHGVNSGVDACIICADRQFGMIGVFSDDGRPFGSEDHVFLRSITNILATAIERQAAQKRLTYLAQYDALTDLPNRRHLANFLNQVIKGAAATGGRAGVMFIDLDHFKKVNDSLGHDVGDQLLVLATQRLRGCVLEGDLVARLGGDEFALVLPAVGGDDDLVRLARALVETLSRPFMMGGQQLFVSASIGIARYPADGLDADTLLKNADTAMYAAKNSGRNNHQLYTAAMQEGAEQRLRLEAQLHLALENGEFLLHYQPKVDLASGALSGFEALLRWRHPERGLVPPLEFISLLEDSGLIIPVGEWVVQEVCAQLRAWQAQGLAVRPVAINLSARQLRQDDLAGAIERIVGASGVDPALLEFELTESMLMADPAAAVAILGRIKELGIRLSIDDFGTGYSSLAYLKRFPLDALKIDRTFVRDLPHDSEDAAITKAVIDLAHSLNLKVVAEGVENVEQLRQLERFGCDEIQGYYIGRPLPAPECVTQLQQLQPAPPAVPA